MLAETNILRQFKRRKYHFFTLIELLVVIAIIAILASMLLPALNKARQTAHKIACVNSLSSLGKAYFMYANDYGHLVPFKNLKMNWFSGFPATGFLAVYLNMNTSIHIGQRSHLSGQAHQPIVRSTISCPGVDSVPLRDPVQGTYSYGYNNMVYAISGSTITTNDDYQFSVASFRDFKVPSKTAVFLESWSTIANIWDKTLWRFPYSNRNNVLFFDGHVDSVLYKSPFMENTSESYGSIFWYPGGKNGY